MVIVLSVGVLITSLVTFKEKNIGYGATIIFSYSGILIKHLSKEGFDGKYILVIVFTIVSIFVITSVNALAIFNLKLKKTDEKPKEDIEKKEN